MDRDKELLQLLLLTTAWLLVKRRNKRRFSRWMPQASVLPPKTKIRRRGRTNVLLEMKFDDPCIFDYYRMDAKTFEALLNIMGPHLIKNSRRTPLPPQVRLAMTLRYLATGETMQSIAGAFNCGRATVCIIVNDTCQRLWTVLAPQYVNRPVSHEEWLKIASDFEDKWNLPHCVGIVDCRHVSVRTQKSLFFSNKLGTGVVMLAICDNKYCFNYLNIEAYDEQSGGGGLMKATDFATILENDAFALPSQCPLPGMIEPMPYYFVGDEQFPLKLNLMRPYSSKDVSEVKKNFNYRLSRVQRCMENIFGILVSRWNIYLHTINAHPLTVRKIIKATVCLHNFLMKSQDPLYCPSNGFVDEENDFGDVVPGEWRAEVNLSNSALQRIGRLGSNMSKRSSVQARDVLASYLVGEKGSVECQWLQEVEEEQNV
ncbi:uncharacterized protein LOC134527401 [Bacillus rossius redtenbacheri]|uniref:uncharacterized protein LOC134527401 n=1 Tax=Bacillus rossius redtenbacheri TaxID=93214 RepID=UPI002FDDF231